MKSAIRLLGGVSAAALLAGAAQAADISGRVTEATGDIGLGGAVVRVLETGQSAATRQDGSFRLSGMPAGRYTVSASYLGADIQTLEVVLVSDAAEETANFRLGDNVTVVDNVLVVGQRGQLNSAINRQRSADGVITVISADAIGQMPDENVAEAVRRAVGVNVINDQGEGRFISIRGIDPNLTTGSFNGVRLPSPEAEDRQLPLDVIDADILSAIVISKTLTPDMDGDSIGGNVEIETLSGLDQASMVLRARLAGIHTDLANETGWRGSLTYADRFADGRLGVAASVSHQHRPFASSNIETGAEWEEDGDLFYPLEVDYRDYRPTRTRTTASLNLDFMADANTRLYARGLYSAFADEELRMSMAVPFEDGELVGGDDGRVLFAATGDDEIEIERSLRQRKETQYIYSMVLGGETFRGPWTIDGQLSWSYAEEDQPDTLYTTMVAEFDSGLFGVDVTDPLRPRLFLGDAATEAAFNTASNYEFDEYELASGRSRDTEWTGSVNLRRDSALWGGSGYTRGGVKIRLREKDFSEDVLIWDGIDGPDFTLDQVQGDVGYDLAPFGPGIDPARTLAFFRANRDRLELEEIDSVIDSNVGDYELTEDIYAGYLMQSVDVGTMRAIYGVRVERTDFSAAGNQVFLAEEGAIVDGVELDDDTVFVTPYTVSRTYTDVLPSVNLRFDLAENLIGRAGYYASIVRPNPDQTAPRVEIERDDENETVGVAGNPDLDRAQAHNLDFALEWYPNRDSVLSAGIFYKSISNFIGAQTLENVSFNGVDFDELETFVNLGDATILGLELNYQQALTFLPGLLSGLIVGANFTYVDSEIDLPDGRTIALPRQSRNVANLLLGYEYGPLDLRAAVSYRDSYIDGIDEGGPGVDRIVTDHTQFDFSAKYNFSPSVQAFVEFKNINNEPYVATVRSGRRVGNAQYETYGWTALFGFQYRY
ncbi:TonB-dependent receptor [Brevundimonas sp.]|uniref:TonB-dependent receptor n=1 Tax=Brevundimonas sp. TaxID=1871086 RepID=UPI00391CB70F